jgi:hypothetical protein
MHLLLEKNEIDPFFENLSGNSRLKKLRIPADSLNQNLIELLATKN